MPITDSQLKIHINRLVELCKFASKDPASLPIRTDEYTRILRAGLRDDTGLSAVVDELIEHCEEIPTPAEMHEAIRRYNTAAAAEKSDREVSARVPDWRREYGPPVAFEPDAGCCDCQMPWKQILAEAKRKSDAISKFIREGRCKGQVRRIFRPYRNSLFEETESDYALAKRLLGIKSHRETCTPRAA